MRDHLRKCFRQGYLENLPVVRRRKPSKVKCVNEVNVFCFSRQPEDKRAMIECNACKEWYHRGCQRVNGEIWKDKRTQFACERCTMSYL